MKELLNVYKEAGKLVSEQVKRAELAGLSDITIRSKSAIERQLAIGADMIRGATDTGVRSTALSGIKLTGEINEKYLIDATVDAGADRITKAGVVNMYTAVNNDVIKSMVNRIYQDGYTFSERIWNVGTDYQDQIKRVISSGFAQGRDPVKIAKDIQVYISDGKTKLVQRYGQLKRGTSAFIKRIGNKVDWRALRLVRSELYASLQESAARQGQINPGTTDMYDWILEQHRGHWSCACPGIAAGSPYKLEEIPDYPHANCRCSVRPVLRDLKKFTDDLKLWSSGRSVPYIDSWYNQYYSQLS